MIPAVTALVLLRRLVLQQTAEIREVLVVLAKFRKVTVALVHQ